MLLFNIIYLGPHTRHACVVDISFRNVHVYSVGTPLNIYIYINTSSYYHSGTKLLLRLHITGGYIK